MFKQQIKIKNIQILYILGKKLKVYNIIICYNNYINMYVIIFISLIKKIYFDIHIFKKFKKCKMLKLNKFSNWDVQILDDIIFYLIDVTYKEFYKIFSNISNFLIKIDNLRRISFGNWKIQNLL